ncbi:MAG: DUF6148 family protein [Defluviitaleaceae bacterium]|nr:DUF6148 family protein [Defluviitaleaceae bacterium]
MISIQTARDMLHGWIMAEQAVQTGQEYQMGTRRLRRADLREIRASVKYWSDKVDEIAGVSRIRVQQIIPRDV